MKTTVTEAPVVVSTRSPRNYLNEERTLQSWLFTTDHKRIGLLYLFSLLFYFTIAAIAAALMRVELLTPEGDLVTSETYNKLFTIHGTLMVWFFLIPSIPAVLGNFVLPMMLGARDVAFPRLNLLSWYLFNVVGVLSLASVVFGGFDPILGGDPVLFQHLFSFYSHPAVYIMILPGMGVISELITCFSRKPIFGYHFVAFASVAIAILSFLVWGHHMFASGQSIYAGLVFSYLSYMVAVPSAIKVFNW